MSLEDLETIADSGSAKVPEGLQDGIMNSLSAAALAEKSSHAGLSWSRRISPAALRISALVSVAFASLAIVLTIPAQPKDTFSDPAQAYAEIEKAFALISSKAAAGFELAAQTGDAFEKTSKVFNR